MIKRLAAEGFGTFWLVFGGCGSAVLAAAFPQLGIGFAGVALAFGLTVLTMAYAVGGISGGHFNPAVSLGLAVAGRGLAARREQRARHAREDVRGEALGATAGRRAEGDRERGDPPPAPPERVSSRGDRSILARVWRIGPPFGQLYSVGPFAARG